MARRTTNKDDDPLRLQFCLAAVALEFGVFDLELCKPDRRGPMIDLARQVAMSLAHTTFGMTHTRIGAILGRDRSTVSHGCLVVEDECDDPIFAARLNRLRDHVRSFSDGLSDMGGACR